MATPGAKCSDKSADSATLAQPILAIAITFSISTEAAEQEVDAHPMDNPVWDHYNNYYIPTEEKIKSNMKVIYKHQVYWCTEKKHIVQQLEYEERNMKRLERKLYESKQKQENLFKELRAMNWHLDELDRDQRQQQQDLESLNRNRKRCRD